MLLLAGSLLLTVAGCRGTPPTPPPVARAEPTPPTPPPPTVATTPSPQPFASPAPASPPPRDPNRDDAPVVVDPGVDDSNVPKTLAEAARAERERRAEGTPATIVVNDNNLHQLAAKGQITVADPKDREKKKGRIVATASAAADPAGKPLRDEQYWRSRALEIRVRWRAASDEIKKLEQQSTELRQRFYSENDSFVRDNRIKPEWDRVTDRLQKPAPKPRRPARSWQLSWKRAGVRMPFPAGCGKARTRSRPRRPRRRLCLRLSPSSRRY